MPQRRRPSGNTALVSASHWRVRRAFLSHPSGRASAEGSNLSEVVGSLDAEFPGLRERLCDEQGEIRNFVNIYVNGEDVRFLQGLDSETKPGDEISIVPGFGRRVVLPGKDGI